MKPITYSMKEVIKLLNITETTIRNYEKKQMISVERSENNYRKFTLKNLSRLVTIRKYFRIGLSSDKIKEMIQAHDFSTVLDILTVQKQDIQKQIEELQQYMDLLDVDIHRAQWIRDNINTRVFIRKPDFRFYSVEEVNIKENPDIVSNYAFMFTPSDLYNNHPPHLGYVRKMSEEGTDQICLYRVYRIDSSIIGTEGTRKLYNEDLIYLQEKGYEICGDTLSIKLFSMQDDDGQPVEYMEAYIPVRKTEK